MSLTAEQRIRNALFVIPFVERNREVNVEDLARRLDMPVEQLVQELDELCMVGTYPFTPDNYVEIYEEGGKVKVALHQNFNRMPRLSLPEALALAVAAGPFSDEGTSGSLATATRVTLDKIRKALPEGLHEVIEQLSARVAVEFESGIERQLEGIRKAIDERLELELEYYTANRDSLTRRVVRPYALLQRKGHWYMVGWCGMRKEPRVFRLSRIYSLEVTDRIFDPPPADFDPVSFLEQRLSVPREGERKFRLRFTGWAGRWIQQRWPESMLELMPDGSVELVFYDLDEEFVLSFTACFGGEAVIVQPESLAWKLAEQARAALAQYE